MEKNKKMVEYKAPSISEYMAMSPADKRVTIAKDVIAALNSELYVAKMGSYILSVETESGKHRINEKEINGDIQQLLPTMKHCEVCALGATILSITKYENKLQMADISDEMEKFDSKVDNLIKEVYTPEQLMMIEIMFEGYAKGVDTEYTCNSGDNYGRDRLGAHVSEEDVISCIAWHHEIKDEEDGDRMYYPHKSTERMIRIFQHIINNNGKIIPGKLKEEYETTENE